MPRSPDTIEIIACTAIGTGLALDVGRVADLAWPFYAAAATVIVLNWFLGPFFEALVNRLHDRLPSGKPHGRSMTDA